MSLSTMDKHFAAGAATDLPGNCKLCGKLVEIPGVNVMHDPDGKGVPIDFCSPECLDESLHILDNLTADDLKKLKTALDAVEQSCS